MIWAALFEVIVHSFLLVWMCVLFFRHGMRIALSWFQFIFTCELAWMPHFSPSTCTTVPSVSPSPTSSKRNPLHHRQNTVTSSYAAMRTRQHIAHPPSIHPIFANFTFDARDSSKRSPMDLLALCRFVSSSLCSKRSPTSVSTDGFRAANGNLLKRVPCALHLRQQQTEPYGFARTSSLCSKRNPTNASKVRRQTDRQDF